MDQRPNILIFLPDAMQAEALAPGSDCQTPHFDRLAQRGLRFTQAHTTCPTCSPARASLMTGLLPHNHGVLQVEHCVDDDQCVLRTDRPHWAQQLARHGYRTGYFGKWHIERSLELDRFGWQTFDCSGTEHVRRMGQGPTSSPRTPLDERLSRYVTSPEGYNTIVHYGVTDVPSEQLFPLHTVERAQAFLAESMLRDKPWCCVVSFSEPNEALIVNRQIYQRYDVDAIRLPPNVNDDLSDRPNLYRRQQGLSREVTSRQWREARTCYYGRITMLDAQFGKLLNQLEESGQLQRTLVIVLSDHGRYVGAHGFDAHNVGAFEEIYRIPLIIAGPGVAAGGESDALVGIQDLCPTLLELTGSPPIEAPDCRSFAELLPRGAAPPRWREGYAEYHGTRFPLMQRILWQDGWKLVFNGFDFDELYHLAADPYEMTNRIGDPGQQERVKSMMKRLWRVVRDTGDRAIYESHYYSMRFAAVGPNAAG